MKIRINIRGLACLLFFALFAVTSYAQSYYEEGTRWTELKLDTLKYDSWFSEVKDNGVTRYVPNYDRTDFYINGDTMYYNFKYVKVWRHTDGQNDSIAYLLSYKKETLMLSSLYHRGGYGNILTPCLAYNFKWELNTSIGTGTLPTAQITGGNPYVFGTIEEIKTGTFGTSVPLEYVEMNGRTIINGIGITSWNGRDCIFGPTQAWYMEWLYNSQISNDYRSILVHFEKNGEVLYDLWPNERGELVTHISCVKETGKEYEATYDLQGRKVEGKLSRGIYIIGGKKRVVK